MQGVARGHAGVPAGALEGELGLSRGRLGHAEAGQGLRTGQPAQPFCLPPPRRFKEELKALCQAQSPQPSLRAPRGAGRRLGPTAWAQVSPAPRSEPGLPCQSLGSPDVNGSPTAPQLSSPGACWFLMRHLFSVCCPLSGSSVSCQV